MGGESSQPNCVSILLFSHWYPTLVSFVQTNAYGLSMSSEGLIHHVVYMIMKVFNLRICIILGNAGQRALLTHLGYLLPL